MDNSEEQIKPETAQDSIHAFRKDIDAVIQKAQIFQNSMNNQPGKHEIDKVVDKLKEGKMWAGKILEEMGSPFPKELADKAE